MRLFKREKEAVATYISGSFAVESMNSVTL